MLHSPASSEATPSCWRRHWFQYTTPSHPQTGIRLLSQNIGRFAQAPLESRQLAIEQNSFGRQSAFRAHEPPGPPSKLAMVLATTTSSGPQLALAAPATATSAARTLLR
jgi:hypothetical protein